MKNFTSIALSILLSLFISACKGQETAGSAAPEAGKAAASSTAAVLSTTTEASETDTEKTEENIMKITAGGRTFTADLADNSSAKALKELLKKGSLTIDMHDYGNFEKVGEIGASLPRNDEQITTEPGDIILYLGTSITIYYDTNSWNFTRLGKIRGASQKELKEALGSGDVTVTFSLEGE